MSLRFICIEVRRNLRCANVFLQFDHSLTETEFLKIVLESEALTLREYSTATRIALDNYFTVEARTVSNLTVEECNASFRLTISTIAEQESGAATTAAAVVPGKGTPATDNAQKSRTVVSIKPRVLENELASLLCMNCECALTGVVEFKRVREFPSGSIDMNEFFCHHGPSFESALVPKLSDFFYGFQFVVLNEELVQRRVRAKGIHVYCKRCLKYLGENLFGGKAVKLWGDALKLHLEAECEDEICDIFEDDDRTPTSQLLNKLVNETTVDESGAQPLLQQMHFCKVLLEATFSNRQRRYLLLQILEKRLEILRNVRPLAHGSHNNNNVLQVLLEPCKCFKLLYRMMDDVAPCGTEGMDGARVVNGRRGKMLYAAVETGAGADADAAAAREAACLEEDVELLNKWKNDMSIHALKISPTLFGLLLDELEVNALLLPEMYRYAQDDFQLSYVFYKN